MPGSFIDNFVIAAIVFVVGMYNLRNQLISPRRWQLMIILALLSGGLSVVQVMTLQWSPFTTGLIAFITTVAMFFYVAVVVTLIAPEPLRHLRIKLTEDQATIHIVAGLLIYPVLMLYLPALIEAGEFTRELAWLGLANSILVLSAATLGARAWRADWSDEHQSL